MGDPCPGEGSRTSGGHRAALGLWLWVWWSEALGLKSLLASRIMMGAEEGEAGPLGSCLGPVLENEVGRQLER